MIKYELLYQTLLEYSPIPKDEWLVLTGKVEEKHFKKGDVWLKAGDEAHEVGFIISGYARMYYIKKDGHEFNHRFMFENMIMAGYPSLLTKTPSTYFIQMMEDTSLLTMKYDEFTKFFERHVCWERLGRRIAEWNYLDKINREYQFLMLDATERYYSMCRDFPGIETRVPQYHLASYLGITASALNRIIKKLEQDS